MNLHKFLDEFGVKVRPYKDARQPRPANVVYGGRTVVRLMKKDVEQTRTVIMCIKASNPTCFDERIVWSVFRFITAHCRQHTRRDVIEMFKAVDLAAINERAQLLATGQSGRMGKTSEKLLTLLADRLL